MAKSFVFRKAVKFHPGTNYIALLSSTTGLVVMNSSFMYFPSICKAQLLMRYVKSMKDSGAYMEKRYAGVKSVAILGLNTGTLDLTLNGWGNQVRAS